LKNILTSPIMTRNSVLISRSAAGSPQKIELACLFFHVRLWNIF
jgi:hypothetical protein